MAKIKLRIGKDEIEIDSRDFYVDNQTIGKVIEDIALHLHECGGRMLPNRQLKLTNMEETDTLSSLEDVEVYEPEFSEPVSVPLNELRGKLLILSKSSFFDQPRTVSEIASEYNVHPNQITTWKKQFISNGANVFGVKSDETSKELQNTQEELFKKIGQQQYEIDWLKKNLKLFQII